jgi:hypothetical protein
MNEVYIVLNDWLENTDLFGIYDSFEDAKNAVNNWADDGEWTSENRFETNYGGTYRIVTVLSNYNIKIISPLYS